MSELIGEFVDRSTIYGESVTSRGNELLLDFFLNETQSADQSCHAGFIGHAELIGKLISLSAQRLIKLTSFHCIIYRATKCYSTCPINYEFDERQHHH